MKTTSVGLCWPTTGVKRTSSSAGRLRMRASRWALLDAGSLGRAHQVRWVLPRKAEGAAHGVEQLGLVGHPEDVRCLGARIKGFLCPRHSRECLTLTTSHQMGQLPAAAIDVATVCVDVRGSPPPVRLRPQARGDQQCDGLSPRG